MRFANLVPIQFINSISAVLTRFDANDPLMQTLTFRSHKHKRGRRLWRGDAEARRQGGEEARKRGSDEARKRGGEEARLANLVSIPFNCSMSTISKQFGAKDLRRESRNSGPTETGSRLWRGGEEARTRRGEEAMTRRGEAARRRGGEEARKRGGEEARKRGG